MKQPKFNFIKILLFILIANSCSVNNNKLKFSSNWEYQTNRAWIGPQYWANTTTDWELNNGKVLCTNTSDKKRTLHVISASILTDTGSFVVNASVHVNIFSTSDQSSYAGLFVGAGNSELSNIERSIIHKTNGKNSGIIAAINGNKELILVNHETNKIIEKVELSNQPDTGYIELNFLTKRSGNSEKILLTAKWNNKVLAKINANIETPISGNFGLISNVLGDNIPSISFSHLSASGNRITINEENEFGPIYTVLQGVNNLERKIAIHFAALGNKDADTAIIEFREENDRLWKINKKVVLNKNKGVNTLNLKFLDPGKTYAYRIIYTLPYAEGIQKKYFYQGVIPAIKDKENIKVIALNGTEIINTTLFNSFDFIKQNYLLPTEAFIEKLINKTPDLIVFTGNQTKSFSKYTSGDLNDFKYNWLIFCRTYNPVLKNTPSIIIPANNDYQQNKIWGNAGNKLAKYPKDSVFAEPYTYQQNMWHQDMGGYLADFEYINSIEQIQTAHIPYKPIQDSTLQNINNLGGNINFLGIDFAIVESNKYKTPPVEVIKDIEIYNGLPYKRWISSRSLDSEKAELLGVEQVNFIKTWTRDWKNTDFKVLLTHEPFHCMVTYPDSFYYISKYPELPPLHSKNKPTSETILKDLHSNSWPQSKSNEFLDILRKGFVFTISGSDNLGSLTNTGTAYWGDGGYTFDVPAIESNLNKRWAPTTDPYNEESTAQYCGNYYDAFYKRLTILAVANSIKDSTEKVQSFGVLNFNKIGKEITVECYKLINDTLLEQYKGWPKTIKNIENNGKNARNYLPTIKITNLDTLPVIEVINTQSQELIYNIRLNSFEFTPKVFEKGSYTVRVYTQGREMVKTDIPSTWSMREDNIIEFDFALLQQNQ